MKLVAWTPLLFSRNGFPRDGENRPFLPGSAIEEALQQAVIFHALKRDKRLKAALERYLTEPGLKPTEVAKTVKKMALESLPILKEVEIPPIVYLPPEKVEETTVEVFDLKEKAVVETFKTEVFVGTAEVEVKLPQFDRIKAAAHSFAEALARIEKEMLEEHPLEFFYENLLNELKRWEIPLRVGAWTEVTFKGDLLFFWKVKPVREFLIKHLGIDIRPRRVLYLPRFKATAGWCELTKKEV